MFFKEVFLSSTENTRASLPSTPFFNKNYNLMAFSFTENKLLHNIFQEIWSDLNFSDKKVLESRLLTHGLRKFLTSEFFI